MRRETRALIALVLGLGLLTSAEATSVVVVNIDGPAEGLNDPTAAAPVTGNPGTTRGQQRLNVIRAAADYWGTVLGSPVPVRLVAEMNPLACTPTTAVLGHAGPSTAVADFPSAPLASTWYPVALANSLRGSDSCPPGPDCGGFTDDIEATFSSALDGSPGCLGGTTWWHGIGAVAPPGTVSLYDTVVHEIGHGLGFSTLVDLSTGSELLGDPDIFETRLWDGGLGQFWPALSDSQRAASAIGGNLHWRGPCVGVRCGFLDAGANGASDVEMYAPNPLEPGSSVAHWDTSLSPDDIMEPLSTAKFEDRLTRGALQDLGWKLSALRVEPVGDANGNGYDDLAVLATDLTSDQNLVFVIDGSTGAEIQRMFFVSAYSPLDLEVVANFAGSGAREVAVLLHDPASGQILIVIKDAFTGATLRTVFYATSLQPIDLEVMTSFAGTPAEELALLVRDKDAPHRVHVMVKDASNGVLIRDIYFANVYMPIDLELVPSFASTSTEEMALLGRDCGDQSVRVLVKDGSSGVLLSEIPFTKDWTPLFLAVIPHAGGVGGTAASEVGLLARRWSDGSLALRFRDASSGAAVSTLNYSRFFDAIDLEILPHYVGGTAAEVGLLMRERADGDVRLLIKDAFTGVLHRSMVFARNRVPTDLAVLPDVSGNAVSEVAVTSFLELDADDRKLIVRDPATDALVRFLDVP